MVDVCGRVAQHYPVMYVAAEDAPGIKVRKAAWHKHHKRPKSGHFYMWPDVLPLLDDAEIDEFVQQIRDLNLKLVVLDTLSQCFAGENENDTGAMTKAMGNAQHIAHATGAAVVIIHHTTKDGSSYRGNSALKYNTYGFLEVSREDELIKLECGRIKNTRPFQPRMFKLVEVDTGALNSKGQPVKSCVIAPAGKVLPGDRLTQSELKLLETLALMTDAVGGAKSAELQSAVGLAGNAFFRPLKRLKALGLVDKESIKHGQLFITHTGRERLVRESAEPAYQGESGAEPAADVFEVNTALEGDDQPGASHEPAAGNVAPAQTGLASDAPDAGRLIARLQARKAESEAA
jgi:hypothetical protein